MYAAGDKRRWSPCMYSVSLLTAIQHCGYLAWGTACDMALCVLHISAFLRGLFEIVDCVVLVLD